MSIRLRCACVVVALGSASSCLPTFPASSPAAAAVVDDFSDPGIDGRYHLQGGTWRVIDGALSTLGDRNLPLWLRAPLSRNVRIEFTSTATSPVVDMKVEVFGDGIRHESGYIVIVGGWNNTLSGIARLDEHEGRRVMRRTRFEAGVKHRWRIERTDGKTLRLFLNDEELAAYVDSEPLFGPRNDRFAFSGWESEVGFDDLKITPLP